MTEVNCINRATPGNRLDQLLLRSNPQNEQLVRNLKTLFAFIIRGKPQVINGQLDYIICGSVAFSLLAMAQRIEVLDQEVVPKINVVRVINVTDEVREVLAVNLRESGDLDVACLGNGWREIRKGDNLLQGADVPAAYVGKSLPLDSSYSTKERSVVKVVIENQEYYLAHPLGMLRSLTSHVILTQDHPKGEKALQDLVVLLAALEKMFDRIEIFAALTAGARTLSDITSFKVPFWRDGYEPTVRRAFTELIDCHPDSHFIKNVQLDRAQSFNIMSLLARLSTKEEKQNLVAFINKYQSEFAAGSLWFLLYQIPPMRLGGALESITSLLGHGIEVTVIERVYLEGKLAL